MRTVVLCGSLGATSAMWEPQLTALRERVDVVAVEHPGHGGAPVVDARDMTALARRALEQVGAARFSFVGLSLGGAVGMRLALDAPERVERLALLCTAAKFGPPEGWLERAALVRSEGLEAIVDAVVARWFLPGFPDLPRFREMFLSTDREGYARCCEALARWDAREEVGAISAATIAIAGSDDPAAPPEALELIASRVGGARLEVIRGARHLANVEHSDEVNRLLLEHLA